MDKQAAIKLLGGTITRGVLWAAAGLATSMGIDTISEDTGRSIGMFVAALVISAVSTYWSKRNEKKLADKVPE